MSLLKRLKSPGKQYVVSLQEPRRHRESVPDFEPPPQQEVVNEESFPEGTSVKTVDTTTASLGKRPRSSDTSPLSNIVLRKPREKISHGDRPAGLRNDIRFGRSSFMAWWPDRAIDNVKASVTEILKLRVDTYEREIEDLQQHS